MKDGAHTHHSGNGGLGVLVAIGAGAVLGARIAGAVIRVLPVLVTGAAVIGALCAAAWITRAVMTYRWQQRAAWSRDAIGAARPGQLTGAGPALQDIAAARRAIGDQHAQLAARAGSGDRPGLAHHQHLHFHGLTAEQVAAVLSATQPMRPPDGADQ